LFVVLDTSIFCRDFLLRGKAFQILLESLKCVPARLCVPEILLDEVVAKYSEALEERVRAFATAQRRLAGLLLDSPATGGPALDVGDAVCSYEIHVKARLLEAGAKILPYPNEPHKRVVEHALLRKKPFNQKGQGYRDYLIWITLRTEMYLAPEETVVLVTGNTLDFCDGSALAESLVEEVSRFHHPGVKVTVLPTLDKFNATYVVPRLELQSKLREALAAHDGSALDLHAWAVRNLAGLLRDEEYIIQATHGLEPEHAHCYVCVVDTIDDVRVTEVRAMSPKRRLVSACAKVVAVLSLDVDWEQYSMHLETRELVGSGLEPFSSASWHETANLTVHFSLVLDEDESAPIVGEIDAVEGPCGVLEINQFPRSAPA